MFGTDDIFSRSVNPHHRTVSKTATQPVCNTHQSAMEPLQLKVRAANCAPAVHGLLSFAAFYTAATQRPTCGYSAWLSQRSHAPPWSLGRDHMSPTPGPTAVPCQVQPSCQPVMTRSGRVVRPNPKYFDT